MAENLQPPAKRSAIEWFARWLAPCLLLAVAAQHLFLVYLRDLTPWIGGGFGMYAVTDMHSMRTMSGECLDSAGQPCLLYLPFDGEKRFIRGGPNTLIRLKQDEALKRQVTDDLFRNGWVRTSADEIAREAGFQDAIGALSAPRRDKAYYRPLTPADPAGIREQAVALPAIRVQMWKLVVDAKRGAVTCVPWGPPLQRGDWR